MTKFLVSIVVGSLFALPAIAHAHQVLTGTVKEVRVDDNARVIITLDDGYSRSGSVACATTQNAMTTSLRRDAGDGILKTATAALLSGKTVTLRGSDNCDDWSGIETAAYIILKK